MVERTAEPVDFEEPAEVEAPDITALQSITGAEIDRQIATARKYPRSVAVFRKQLRELVTLDAALAETMYYCLPRGKDENNKPKFIEGPSVRLAEAAVASWTNIRSGGRPLMADATHVTCQGFAHDLQNNNFVAFEVKRRITGKFGRFNEDMITVTGAAGSKIAWRNAIFGVIPRAFINEAWRDAKRCAAGALKSVTEARKDALAWWQEQGGALADLLALFDRKGMDDVTIDDLMRLKGIRTAIDDGDTDFNALLRDIRAVAATQVRTDGLTAEAILNGKAKGKDEPAGRPDKPAEPAKPEPEKVEPAVAASVEEALPTKTEPAKPAPEKPEPKPEPTSDAAAKARSLFSD